MYHAFSIRGQRVGLFPIQHLPEFQDQFVRNERFLNEGNSLLLGIKTETFKAVYLLSNMSDTGVS